MIPVTMRSERTEPARRNPSPSTPTVDHPALAEAQGEAARYLERVLALQARYRAGQIHVSVPPRFADPAVTLEKAVARDLPASQAALDAAANGLFSSLPVAFDPAESVGPYLATLDRASDGEPYRFMDLGALIATQPFGENDPGVIASVLRGLPFVASRYAHSEYQTTLSLKLKGALSRIAPAGTPRFFIVNTGAEAVENAIKAVLLNRVKTAPHDPGQGDGPSEKQGFFIVPFEGAFHGRTLGSLAATHKRKARLGFPTFDWPHALFPVEEPRSPKRTQRRDEKALEQVWTLLVTGRQVGAPRPLEQFKRQLEACDELLARLPADRVQWPAMVQQFVELQRALVDPAVLRRAQRVAGVLVEPIQCEGGLKFASSGFFQRLRLLTRIYDVPLMFDEVQTGWGATGKMWAHDHFDLPCPPDVVVWAKKAQNGVLFVSEDLATFFQEEKKFNTTWEGDSVGMLRLLHYLDRLDLEQIRRTGALAREGLEQLARDYKDLLQNPRGQGVMLALDVVRADWREWVRERAFRNGLILLPAGERTLRFYPRYDMEPSAIQEALAILRRSVQELVGAPAPASVADGIEVRPGTLDVPPQTLQVVDLNGPQAKALLPQVHELEDEQYGSDDGRRSLLQFPPETLEATLGHLRSIGVGLRDRVSGRLVAYAIGSPLENHDELGVRDDPSYGDNNAVYLQAMALDPRLKNQAEVEQLVLDAFRARAEWAGFVSLSTLIERRVLDTGPAWMKAATVVDTIENYMQSGVTFAYLRSSLVTAPVEGSP
ncbi:MAG: aminotransferase class III-fold pyridoxal phosphate-dependent enzyme [Anaeromyxobacteraceae bacterium]|nr:aminotransferase class III-fold pyridoxal phosphate-dependent enzyme [Anaeromyxobacteraceae bacterium]